MTIVPLPKIEGYAIYNPKTNLWSRGGYGPKWGKKPKIWSNMGHLKNHIHQTWTQVYGWDDELRPWASYEVRRKKIQKILSDNNYDQSKDRVFLYSYSDSYDGCQIFDITTQSELTEFKIYDFIIHSMKLDAVKHKRYIKGKIFILLTTGEHNATMVTLLEIVL